MLRTTLLALAVAAPIFAPLATARVANAAYISTATIEGNAIYSANGNLSLSDIRDALGVAPGTQDNSINQVINNLGRTGYNFALALSLTDFDINLPDVNKVADWNIAIDFDFNARYREFGSQETQTFDFNFADDTDIGTFSINQAASLIAGITFTDLNDLESAFLGLVSGFPEVTPIDGPAPGFNPIGALLLTDDVLPYPSLILLLQRDPLAFLGLDDLNIRRGVASISAELTLTAIPEPASIALLGLGLAGLGLSRRRVS